MPAQTTQSTLPDGWTPMTGVDCDGMVKNETHDIEVDRLAVEQGDPRFAIQYGDRDMSPAAARRLSQALAQAAEIAESGA